MYDSKDRRPGTGRPSLLSPDTGPGADTPPITRRAAERAPAPDSRGILSQLDGGAAAPGAARRRASGLAVGAMALLLAGVGGLLWIAAGGAVSDAPKTVLAAQGEEHIAGVPTASLPVAHDAEPPSPPASAALIQEDPLAALDPAASASSAAPAGAGAGELAALLAAAPSAAASKEDVAKPKAARTENKRAQTSKPKKAASAKKPETVDSDAALLAALLAHSKHPDGQQHSTEFARCAALSSVTQAQRCRARLCEGSARGSAECKTVRVSKAPG